MLNRPPQVKAPTARVLTSLILQGLNGLSENYTLQKSPGWCRGVCWHLKVYLDVFEDLRVCRNIEWLKYENPNMMNEVSVIFLFAFLDLDLLLALWPRPWTRSWSWSWTWWQMSFMLMQLWFIIFCFTPPSVSFIRRHTMWPWWWPWNWPWSLMFIWFLCDFFFTIFESDFLEWRWTHPDLEADLEELRDIFLCDFFFTIFESDFPEWRRTDLDLETDLEELGDLFTFDLEVLEIAHFDDSAAWNLDSVSSSLKKSDGLPLVFFVFFFFFFFFFINWFHLDHLQFTILSAKWQRH